MRNEEALLGIEGMNVPTDEEYAKAVAGEADYWDAFVAQWLLRGKMPGSIDQRLMDFDVSLHLSIWPETYCLTLSEAWRAGLVTCNLAWLVDCRLDRTDSRQRPTGSMF